MRVLQNAQCLVCVSEGVQSDAKNVGVTPIIGSELVRPDECRESLFGSLLPDQCQA